MDDIVLKTSARQVERGRQTRDRLLEAIKAYIGEHGYSPTVRELGDMVGLKSTASVHFQLRALAIEKRITWKPEQPRTVRPR